MAIILLDYFDIFIHYGAIIITTKLLIRHIMHNMYRCQWFVVASLHSWNPKIEGKKRTKRNETKPISIGTTSIMVINRLSFRLICAKVENENQKVLPFAHWSMMACDINDCLGLRFAYDAIRILTTPVIIRWYKIPYKPFTHAIDTLFIGIGLQQTDKHINIYEKYHAKHQDK